jgi:hypothetical protein
VRGLWLAHAWLRDHGSPTVRMAAPLLARYIKSLLPSSVQNLRSMRRTTGVRRALRYLERSE